jgi:hypothetical protein
MKRVVTPASYLSIEEHSGVFMYSIGYFKEKIKRGKCA